MVERMSSPLRWIRDRFGTDGDASRRQDAAAGNSRASRSAASAASSQPSPDASGRPLTQVGASPFDRSLADSTVGGSTAAGPSPQHASAVGGIHGGAPTVNEFDEALRQDFEGGDGGDSDEEGAEVDVLDNPELRLYPHLLHRNGPRPPGTDPTDIDLDPNDEGHESTNSSSTSAIEGAPPGWKEPGPPESFEGYVPKEGSGAPARFEDVDNPAAWPPWVFRPKYDKQKKFTSFHTPAGAKVVPAGAGGKRVINDWEFFYDGWKPDAFDQQTYVRGNATRENIKPEDRESSLDVEYLKKFGCTAKTVKGRNFLWFLNLLLPVHETDETGIEGDERMPFFSWVARYTNAYAASSKRGAGYGHKWESTDAAEMVRFFGVPIRNGSLDGKPGSIYARWDSTSPLYDKVTAKLMTISRWQMIKRNFKLNNNLQSKSKGEPGYDPCHRYNFIIVVLCHNTNKATLWGAQDLAGDETTWGYMGFMGECGGRLMNKPVSKGKCATSPCKHSGSMLLQS